MLLETLLNYQQRMGWNDRISLAVLCDFIEKSLGHTLKEAEQVNLLERYLEERAQEEESWCRDPEDMDGY